MLTEKDVTPAQWDSLMNLYTRQCKESANPKTLNQFLDGAWNSPLLGCVMVPWCGMQIGIETDGYTHS